MTTLDEIGTYLAGAGAGTLGTDLFLGEMPEVPIECAAVYEQPGVTGNDMMGGNSLPSYERPNLQVLTRSEDYVTARSRAETVYQAMTQVGNATLSGNYWLRVQPLQAPFLIGRDGMGRYLVSCNYQTWKAVS